ncbi:MAG: hypothetical protein ACD_80C00166G0007 [uncultured bacterium (gcode 4)]|uniref:SCP domain-containing protein n=1 Tax=uncultured bacterium (gcode 4) TaxID=1234023 RepID=K1XHM5_9BACT|nr:MAG: hypothetical protein ACD_80C00166G0007 [uncultured bacterium (gcode 4)]
MDKKNIHDDVSAEQTKPKKNKKAGFFLTTATIASLMANTLTYSPGYGQQDITWGLPKKNTTELVEKKDTLSYDEIKKYPVSWIVKEYGNEKAMEILQNCSLIELNKIRKANWVPPVALDEHLIKAAQKYAEEMDKNKRFSHISKNWANWEKRVKKAGYKWEYISENIWYNLNDIAYAFKSRTESSPHFHNMIDPKFKYVWIGVYDEYRVLSLWWR